MSNNKSILEEALLQVQTLEEALKSNAKGILANTMKQELNDLMKESLEQEKSEEEVAEQVMDDEDSKEEDEKDMTDDAETADDENMDDLDNTEPEKDETDTFGADTFSDDNIETPSMEDDMSDDMMNDEDDMSDVVDMTGASEEEVLKVFKAMKPEDGIIVKKDGNEIEFNSGDDEYIIKLDDEEEKIETPSMNDEFNDEFEDESSLDMNEDNSSMEDEEEVVYEIDLGEEEDETKDEESSESDVEESARTIGMGVRGPGQKKMFKSGRPELNEEVEKLKKQNGEYKKALILFKDKLNEVAVFNANLAYATRLFTEHSTTKQEKMDILKRFDSISTMNESKQLYGSIKNELNTKRTVTESVVEKISATPTSSSTNVLAESKVYENPQFARVKDLMKKIK